MSESYDSAANSRGCYELAIKAARERCIRSGQILPDTTKPDEVRWQREGPRPSSELDAARELAP